MYWNLLTIEFEKIFETPLIWRRNNETCYHKEAQQCITTAHNNGPLSWEVIIVFLQWSVICKQHSFTRKQSREIISRVSLWISSLMQKQIDKEKGIVTKKRQVFVHSLLVLSSFSESYGSMSNFLSWAPLSVEEYFVQRSFIRKVDAAQIPY